MDSLLKRNWELGIITSISLCSLYSHDDMSLRIIIISVLFLCIGCSVIDKSSYMKGTDHQNGWQKVKNINYTRNFPFRIPWDPWSCYQYYSCDSCSSLALDFSNLYYSGSPREFVSVGPPFLPLFPLSVFDRIPESSVFTVQLQIGTMNCHDIDSIVHHIHFVFNDTVQSFPFDIRITKGTGNISNLYNCTDCNNTPKSLCYIVRLKFKKSSSKLRTLSVVF